jgi:hypothetical protein
MVIGLKKLDLLYFLYFCKLENNLFILHILVNIMKCKKNKLFCAFIDFAAAVNIVWRDGLWNKLLINQINGKMYNVFFSMYNGSKSRVVYNCNKT